TVEEGDVFSDQLDTFKEAGACGTAPVITPIGGISYKDNLLVFYSQTVVGPVTQRLNKELTGVESGDVEAPAGWIVK
ncbi:branched chain amino acid aminotransferase, partial [Pseudomonas syringae pv. tagetis]